MRRRRPIRRQVDDDLIDAACNRMVRILRLPPGRYEAVRDAYPAIKDQLPADAWAHEAFAPEPDPEAEEDR